MRNQSWTLLNPHQHARTLVLRYGWDTVAYQILNPGLSYWFAPQGEAVVGYTTSAGFRVVAGSPICPPDQLPAIITAFEADAAQHDHHVCYFATQARMAQLVAAQNPQSCILIGAQPTWNPQHWPHILASKASLRAQASRARNKQLVVCRWSAEQATNHPGLQQCLREWLETRDLPPMHFLVEPETLACLEDRHVYVAERHNQIVGFLIASPIPLRNGWFIEQIIRGHAAPNGTAELLLDAAMRDAATSESPYLTLGLSPLSRRAGIAAPTPPRWLHLLLSWVRAHGNRFYNFDGLDAFKARIQPEAWEPVYAITNEPRFTPRTCYAIAGAFSGTSPARFLGQGVARAMSMEIHWLARTMQRHRSEP